MEADLNMRGQKGHFLNTHAHFIYFDVF